MGLYKRCIHAGTTKESSCDHDWWAQFKLRGEKTNHRHNLSKWITGDEKLSTKGKAEIAFARFEQAIRNGRFRAEGEGAMRAQLKSGGTTVEAVTDAYITSYIVGNDIKGDEANKCRRFAEYFRGCTFAKLTTEDVELYRAHLRESRQQTGRAPDGTPTTRKVAKKNQYSTVIRHMARLRALWNWAMARDYVDHSPFTKAGKAIIKFGKEKNWRGRRLNALTNEEGRLMEAMSPDLQRLFAIALDTGLRQGELLTLTVASLQDRPGWIRVKATNAKSQKHRDLPTNATKRLPELLAALQARADGTPKGSTELLVCRPDGRRLPFPQDEWTAAKTAAGVADLKWHDLRREFASRLAIDLGRPLPEVQILLGHGDVKTTMRYIGVSDANLSSAVAGLEQFSRPVAENPGFGDTSVAHNRKKGRAKLALVAKAG